MLSRGAIGGIASDKGKKLAESHLKGCIGSFVSVTDRTSRHRSRETQGDGQAEAAANTERPGSPGHPDDSPVYLLHGLLGTASAHFGRQIRSWSAERTVHGIDLPGHGRAAADAQRPYWRTAVSQVIATMSATGPGHLVGASYLGGTIAVRVAATRPALVRSLVLSGFTPDVPYQSIAAWVGGFASLAKRQPALADEYERLHGVRWHDTLRVVTEEIGEDYPTRIRITAAMLDTLTVPTLVINGGLRGDERCVASSLPSRPGRLEVGIVPSAGHMVQYEAADVFNAMVARFWSRLDVNKQANDGAFGTGLSHAEEAVHVSR